MIKPKIIELKKTIYYTYENYQEAYEDFQIAQENYDFVSFEIISNNEHFFQDEFCIKYYNFIPKNPTKEDLEEFKGIWHWNNFYKGETKIND